MALGDALLVALSADKPSAELVTAIKSALIGATQAPTALARATALWVWKRAWQAEHPEARRGGDRKSASFQEKIKLQTLQFDQMAGEATGLQPRTILADIELAQALGHDSIRDLWTSPIADNAAALGGFSQLTAQQRRSVLQLWGDNPKLSFRAALVAAKLRPADNTDEIAFQNLVGAWDRASTSARRRFLARHLECDPAAAEAVIVAWRKRGSAAAKEPKTLAEIFGGDE